MTETRQSISAADIESNLGQPVVAEIAFDRQTVKARMRETVIKILTEMPAEGRTALTDEDIDRLIERAIGPA